MSKTGNSKYYPKNTSVYIPDIKERAEIFWQTVNANHLLENYNDKISQWGKDHDLKFNDFKNLLSGNTVMSRTKGDNFIAVAYDSNKKDYTLIKRFQQTFIIIITAYATKDSNHIKAYKDYEAETRRKYAP